jgi:hypothetical protein
LDIYIQDVKSELNINNMQYFWTETGYLGDTSDTPSSDIMYAKKRFIPTCTNISTIYVMHNFTNCYEDLPVSVSL